MLVLQLKQASYIGVLARLSGVNINMKVIQKLKMNEWRLRKLSAVRNGKTHNWVRKYNFKIKGLKFLFFFRHDSQFCH